MPPQNILTFLLKKKRKKEYSKVFIVESWPWTSCCPNSIFTWNFNGRLKTEFWCSIKVLLFQLTFWILVTCFESTWSFIRLLDQVFPCKNDRPLNFFEVITHWIFLKSLQILLLCLLFSYSSNRELVPVPLHDYRSAKAAFTYDWLEFICERKETLCQWFCLIY